MPKEKWLIPEEKSRRIASAFIIAGVLVIFVLALVIGYLFVEMGYKNKESKRLDAEIEKYNELIEQQEHDLEYYKSERWKYQQAVENGGWKTRGSNENSNH